MNAAGLDRNLEILSNNKVRKEQAAKDDTLVILPKGSLARSARTRRQMEALMLENTTIQGGRLEPLDKQLLLMSGDVKDSDWKAEKATAAALETRWIALLLKLYSEPYRTVRGNLESLARISSRLDTYGGILSENCDLKGVKNGSAKSFPRAYI